MAKFTAVDGGTIELTVDDLAIEATGATRVAVWDGPLGQHVFAVGDRDSGHEIAAREGVQLTEEYRTLEGATVHIGHQSTKDSVTGVLARYTLAIRLGYTWCTRLWVPESTSTEVLHVLDQFQYVETPAGVRMLPRDTGIFWLARDAALAPYVLCHVHGLGLVEVLERTDKQRGQLPSRRGAEVVGGELWIESESVRDAPHSHVHTAGQRHFAGAHETMTTKPVRDVVLLLAAATATARVYSEVSDESERQVVSSASRLRVSWSPPRA